MEIKCLLRFVRYVVCVFTKPDTYRNNVKNNIQQYLCHSILYIQFDPEIQKCIALTIFLKQLNSFLKSKSFSELLRLATFNTCYLSIQLIFID